MRFSLFSPFPPDKEKTLSSDWPRKTCHLSTHGTHHFFVIAFQKLNFFQGTPVDAAKVNRAQVSLLSYPTFPHQGIFLCIVSILTLELDYIRSNKKIKVETLDFST